MPSSWERIASLKKPLGRKANERLVTLVTVFKGGHICQILAPFFNLCIELLPLDYFWSFSIFLFDVLAQKFPTLSWSLSQHRVIGSVA